MQPTDPIKALYDHPQEDGLIGDKYIVTKWSDIKDETVDVDEWTFVLIPEKDPHARVAIAAYAESIRAFRPQLATELDQVLSDYR